MALREYLLSEVAQDCSDGVLTRREALRRLGLMGLGATSAAALLAACGGGDDGGETRAATTTTAGGPTSVATSAPGAAAPVEAEEIRFAGPDGELVGAYAAAADPQGAVLVIHENRGLTPHFRDVVGRFARVGYSALCVDLLSGEGGTAAIGDEGAAIAALAARPLDALLADLRAGLDELERRVPGAAVGAVGFCFGGAMVWNLLDAGEPRLAAAVPFYGPVPASADFSGSAAAVLAIYAGLDTRVNATRDAAQAALESAGLTHEIRTFEGVDHAFFNDTGPRYDAEAARDAYAAVLDWFGRHLA